MTIHYRRGKSDIIREENLNYLQGKIEHSLIFLPNNQDEEEHIIENMISALVEHGKDENQMRQIAQIAKAIAEELGYDDRFCTTLEKAALLYDIGNIVISDEIYAKEDRLSFEEFVVVKNHTVVGYDFLSGFQLSSMQLAATLSREHHEWWNGTGYPKQLQTDEISIASRIIALADVVGALFTRRAGRDNWDYVKILKYIKARKGLQFDPKIVDAFMSKKAKMYHILCRKHGSLKK